MADKTQVPGMGDNNYFESQNKEPRRSSEPFGNPSAHNMGGEGTRIPMSNGGAQNVPPRGIGRAKSKPLVGFLYSVSRTAFGEYWPLYQGVNTIGRDASSDIQLSESTVSGSHAELVVRKMKNPESLLISITDTRSTCGTMVNGESLGFTPHECKNWDVITVGESYELLLIVVDTAGLGLTEKPDFVDTGAATSVSSGPQSRIVDYNNPVNDTRDRISNPSSDRTQTADGPQPSSNGGGTRTR